MPQREVIAFSSPHCSLVTIFGGKVRPLLDSYRHTHPRRVACYHRSPAPTDSFLTIPNFPAF